MKSRAIFGGARKTSLLIVLCAALLLALAAFAAVGCGGSEDDAVQQEQDQVSEETAGEGQEDTATESDEGSEDDSGIPSSGGNTAFSLELQEIGEGNEVAAYKLSDVTWEDHGEFFRVIFELKNADGSDVTEIPYCNTWYVSEYYDIGISLNNIITYKFDYAPFAAAEVPVSLGDPLVETIERMFTADTEPVGFRVICAYSEAHPGTSSRPHRLMYITDPMRVLLDIQKM